MITTEVLLVVLIFVVALSSGPSMTATETLLIQIKELLEIIEKRGRNP